MKLQISGFPYGFFGRHRGLQVVVWADGTVGLTGDGAITAARELDEPRQLLGWERQAPIPETAIDFTQDFILYRPATGRKRKRAGNNPGPGSNPIKREESR